MKKPTAIFYLFVFLFFSFGVQLLVNRAIAGCCQYSIAGGGTCKPNEGGTLTCYTESNLNSYCISATSLNDCKEIKIGCSGKNEGAYCLQGFLAGYHNSYVCNDHVACEEAVPAD